MRVPSPPADEVRRLVALAEYRILDTEPEAQFDDLTRLAAHLCGAPVALISLVESERQWFKSRVGLATTETPRTVSFCSHAIEDTDLLIVPDATLDARFAGNPLVTGAPHIRSYAGAPLWTAEGHALGTLCVIDHVPREFSPEQQEALRTLSRQVMAQLDLRRTVRDLAAREQLLLAVSAESTDAVFVKDGNGRYLLLNEAASAVAGRPPGEVLGQDASAVFEPESEALISARDRRVLETGRAETEEETLTSAGVQRTFLAMRAPYRDHEGNIIGTVGVARDITDRKRSEAALRSSEQLYRSLVTTMAEGVVFQQADGRITACNPAAERILGQTADQIMGRTSLDPRWRAIHGDGSPFPGDEHPSMVALRTGAPQMGVVMGVHRTDGSLVWISINAQPIFQEGASESAAVVCSFADVTACKNAEDDLRASQALLIQQERLRAFGQMASGVAHDINNAICPVSIYTKVLLKTEGELSPRAREYLEIIQNAAKAAGDTVARLRKFYREENDQDASAPVCVATLIREAGAITRARWGDMAQESGVVIDLRTELPAELPAIDGIASEITEALINLIFNAVDAMPEGGTLTVRARAFHRVPGEPAGVCVEVADTGIGMDEATRRRCLEPFFTTKGRRGTGIGLSIVSGILQRHRAEIAIESALGAGTTMRLLFPPPRLRPESPRETSAALPVPEMKILVADDEPRVLQALRVALESEGHRPICVPGGQVALLAFQAARDAGDPFDAVFTDLGMPHVDGRKVAAAVKAAAPATPVILLTGWGQDVWVDGGMPPGVDRLLAKPVAPQELTEALAACRALAPRSRQSGDASRGLQNKSSPGLSPGGVLRGSLSPVA